MKKLPKTFYTRHDVVKISKELLGKVLCTNIDGLLTKAIITETEAYAGTTDKASHAYGGRRTPRTEVMFAEGGCAYIYLCYGMHSLFNVVTSEKGIPHAVLIRAAQPLAGTEIMLQRSGKKRITPDMLQGPGKVAKALGLHFSLTGTNLLGNKIWIEDHNIKITEKNISSTPRIGIDYAGEDAKLPYRFVAMITV